MEFQDARKVSRASVQAHDTQALQLDLLNQMVTNCAKCPRLVHYREEVAKARPARFVDWQYWTKPVPGFGDPHAKILLVGLAPAANGGNRTGRVFTGDKSGDFLVAVLHKLGLANQPTSSHRNDGLELRNVYITAAVKCAPPDNKPTRAEILQCCERHLTNELQILKTVEVIVCLGRLAYDSTISALKKADPLPKPHEKFAHGASVMLGEGRPTVLASYHPSPRNTQTGTLTKAMLTSVLRRATRIASIS